MTKGLENGWHMGEASRDFDVRRAFAHGEYMGALREQEHIIKLLEDHAIEVDEGGGCECKSRCPNIMNDFDYQDHLLALIKGENK